MLGVGSSLQQYIHDSDVSRASGLKQRRGANHPYWHSLTGVSVN